MSWGSSVSPVLLSHLPCLSNFPPNLQILGCFVKNWKCEVIPWNTSFSALLQQETSGGAISVTLFPTPTPTTAPSRCSAKVDVLTGFHVLMSWHCAACSNLQTRRQSSVKKTSADASEYYENYIEELKKQGFLLREHFTPEATQLASEKLQAVSLISTYSSVLLIK